MLTPKFKLLPFSHTQLLKFLHLANLIFWTRTVQKYPALQYRKRRHFMAGFFMNSPHISPCYIAHSYSLTLAGYYYLLLFPLHLLPGLNCELSTNWMTPAPSSETAASWISVWTSDSLSTLLAAIVGDRSSSSPVALQAFPSSNPYIFLKPWTPFTPKIHYKVETNIHPNL